MPEPELDNDGKTYYLKAYLFAGQTVSSVHVKRILKYLPVVDDSVNQLIPEETWVTDAKVTLFLDDSIIPLEIDTYGKRDYISDHVVQEGGHYRIVAEQYDTLLGKTITMSAETVCPHRDAKIHLDRDTLEIDQSMIEKEFWQMYKSPESYPHFTLFITPSDQYQMLEFSASGKVIIDTRMPAYLKRIPMKMFEMIVSPIHFQSYRFYPDYKLIVNHLNKEYADIYTHNGPESDAWLHGNTELLPEGISNVSNGGGIFTAIASDTIPFHLVAKK